MKKLTDSSLLRFLLVGVGNTLLSAVIMFALYETAGFGYWASTAIAYAAGGILSFLLNRSFTFHSRGDWKTSALRFAVTVAVCYVLAYSLAKPLVTAFLSGTTLSLVWQDRFSMVYGMGLYTILNYCGQRFFAFRNGKR